MAQFKQQDKYEIYFTPQQSLRLKQEAFSRRDIDRHRGVGGRHKGGNVSEVVRNAVDEYFNPAAKISKRECEALLHAILCVEDLSDKRVLRRLMEENKCWDFMSVALEAKSRNLHLRGR